MSRTDRALARDKRIKQFSHSVSFRSDAPGNSEAVSAFNNLRKNPLYRKRLTLIHRKSIALAEVYRINGPGLYIDHYVRHFLTEYNSRILRGEGANMPSSFSIMRSFVDPDDDALILKLLPERPFSITINRLLDHLTDPSVDTTPSNFIPDLEELTIYEVNMLGGFSDFSLPGHEDFIFCGCAFVREDTELSLMGLFGRKNPEPKISMSPVDELPVPGKEFLLNGRKEINTSDDALFGDKEFQPVILMMRMDLERGTTQARYVFHEQVDSFSIGSDDPEMLEYLRDTPNAEERVNLSLDVVKNHSDLFSLLSQMPSFCGRSMDKIEDDFVLERRPTRVRMERDKPTLKRHLDLLAPRDKPQFIDVQSLYELTSNSTIYEMKLSGLVVESSGYWKTLSMAETGADKAGRPVQGKTWVQTQSSWFQSKIAKIAENATVIDVKVGVSADERIGEIYVLRSAAHPKHLYKVGFTTKSAQQRADQLASTSGQPDIFNVVQSWRVKNPREIEHQVHVTLSDYRVNKGREFFSVEYSRIREVIEKVINQNNAFVAD